MKKILILTVFLFAGIAAFSQFTINGESRTRGYLSYGYQNLPAKGDVMGSWVEQRTRVNFLYTEDSLASFYVSLQDARVWGESMNTKDVMTGIYEAWIELYLSSSKNTFFRIGRQNVAYDNGRIVADGDWNNWGNAFDIALFNYSNEAYKFKLNWAGGINNLTANYFQNLSDYDVDFYKYLTYLWLNKKSQNERYSLSFMMLLNYVQKNDQTFLLNGTTTQQDYPDVFYGRATAGTFYSLNFIDNWFLEGDAYFQFGKDRDGNSLDAYLLSAFLSYQHKGVFNLGVGYQITSGNDWSANEGEFKNKSFDYNMFGMEGNTFFGELNYFSTPANVDNAGLQDIVAGLEVFTGKKTSLCFDGHIFSLQHPYLSSGQKVDKHLGVETDLTFNWNIREYLSFGFIYGIIKASDGLKALQPSYPATDYQDYGQMLRFELSYNPQLYKN